MVSASERPQSRFGFIAVHAFTLIVASATAITVADEPVPVETALVLDVPSGLEPRLPIPTDNPLTVAKIALGRKLFFDPLLSADGKVACATCHEPNHGFAQPRALPVGFGGRVGRRNAPGLLNRAFGTALFWDGRARVLEAQALLPIENDTELGIGIDEMMRRLAAHKTYPAKFEAAFADGLTPENVARAIVSFERTLLMGDSPIDRFRAAEYKALTPAERQGLWIYESRGRCWQCHSGPNFTDEGFHNTGVGWGHSPADLGRFEVTGRDDDRGRFKTPSLRGVALTAPYMHDGSIATLDEVVRFYVRGGRANPYLDRIIEPLDLSPEDEEHIVAFLRALSRFCEPATAVDE